MGVPSATHAHQVYGYSPPPDEPVDEPVDKPKQKQHKCKCKPRVFKEKQYKIHQGSHMNKKWCPLCHEVFNSQLELNWHMENYHKYTFIHPKWSCGVEFSSEAALKKHAKVHLPFAFKCPTCQKGFHYKYKLDNHKNTHTDFVIKCKYPHCNKVYKSEGEY